MVLGSGLSVGAGSDLRRFSAAVTAAMAQGSHVLVSWGLVTWFSECPQGLRESHEHLCHLLSGSAVWQHIRIPKTGYFSPVPLGDLMGSPGKNPGFGPHPSPGGESALELAAWDTERGQPKSGQ